jgi:hypothetical protein
VTPQRASEPDAEFFDRIAGPFWDQVRDVINEWWSHLPDQARPDMRTRLLDRNSDRTVSAALWELYLHEMLIGSGCAVDIEPAIGTGATKPDFLVSRNGKRFVVEAICTTQRVGDLVAAAVPPQLLDAINSVPSPNFFLSYTLHTTGSNTPSQKRLKADLKSWLAGLDPDHVFARYKHGKPFPRRSWEQAGWHLTFEAIPRDPGGRGGSTSRTIGIHPPIAWIGDDSDRIFEAVKEKGSKYGELGMPFIVAVGNVAAFPEDRDTETALYGTLIKQAHAGTPIFGRKSDGYWTAAYEHSHSWVSGVLTVDMPAPWTWTTKTPVLWLSSDPESLAAPVLPVWSTARLLDARVQRRPAASLAHTVLGLPAHWPVGDAFPRHDHSKAD